MVNWSIVERIFYTVGSLVALILGGIQIKNYFEPPKVKLRPYFFFDKKIKNKYGQDVIPLEYECDLLNTGRDLVGELILKIDPAEVHNLSGIINLRKNIPYKSTGTEKIIPMGINIKEIKTPFKAKVFFQDIKGRKHAIHKITLGEGGAGWSHTKHSL
jgi:hypothetical protein